MECYTCKSIMKCVDDINTGFLKLEYYECPKCKSKQE